ncbi:hypothetical protein CA54_32340 [Symmachiella macrocystis]|uniref:Sulfatase n=1 Tax=Symmachiella macrocystis TaxID=2527985 RepID=A0A5C6BUG8_9PLAN|nr:DUF1501 domain-containing protein [Symmachiella macrocystis]TWU14389.1 hypothetical protein CA54_32340 [Symmachiella macrocystis]
MAIDRREFLWRYGGGLGGIALASLLDRDGLLAETSSGRLEPIMHHPPRAKRVVQFYMSGAASQCDLFDYKPALLKKNGEPFDPGEKVELFQSSPGKVMQSPWKWRAHGECGKMISDIVPHIGSCADDIAFVHSMVAKSNIHGPATLMQATGFVLPGFPSAGSWVQYALGSLNDNLPAFVVLPDSRGFAPSGPQNWSAGFLPASYQGTMIRPSAKNPISDLFPPEAGYVTAAGDAAGQDVLAKLNQRHADQRPGDSRLSARIRSYELAAKLQVSAPQVLDITEETAATQKLYGVDQTETAEVGRNCLVARRMLERGVRFVQIWSGADNGHPRRNWDSHENVERDHGILGTSIDKPIAGLIKDLKQRGMLDDTIILWTTEFGRMPCSQGNVGRDHNPFGFTNWLAGGGIKGGVTYGATDEWSYKAVEDPAYCYDIHATLLHLLGIDHERLTFRHNGIDRRLTDVHGQVINKILA